MNPFLSVLFRALAAAPLVAEDIEAALTAHWGKDHVAQAVQGVAVLQKVIGDVAAAAAPAQTTPQS